MKQVARNWGVRLLLAIYLVLGNYALYGMIRAIGVVTITSPTVEIVPLLDAWWMWLAYNLIDSPVLTYTLIVGSIYVAVGVVRMTLSLGTCYDENPIAPTVEYKPLFDLWWTELVYLLSLLRRHRQKPIRH